MPVNQSTCPDCGLELLLQGRYRVIQRLGNGSFGQVFEVEDMQGATHDRGARKVLKVLSTDYPLAVCLFQREARVLSELKHPGIPNVELDGYFKLSPQNSKEPLHCLVMEKIEGINLQEWLRRRNNQPLTQEQAIAWLKQLAEILQQVHQRNYFHRDIKPSNIMLKPDGQLVLIDFGAVREVTATYSQYGKDGKGGTAIISPGYTPPEQADGRAVFTSDFYALGRTFVHLLTGIHPHNFDQCPQTDRLYWRNRVPHINQELADLIDQLMAPLSANRPRNAEEILQRLQEIKIQIRSRISTLDSNKITAKKLIYSLPLSLVRERNLLFVTSLFTTDRALVFVIIAMILLVGNGVAISIKLVEGDEIDRVENDSSSSSDRTQQLTACDSIQDDDLSCGEEILVPDSGIISKQEGVQKFTNGNYDEAIRLLQKARKEDASDPETFIYLNNAKVANQKTYTIAVAAPLGKNSNNADITNKAQEILRGVAQAQEEINERGGIDGIPLRVLIADDANNRVQAQQIANKLVLRKDILGVVGHFASEVTLEAVPVYQDHKLVVVSPGSTSEELSAWGKEPDHVFFRTVPTTKVAADYLIKHLKAQSLQKIAAIFNVPQSSFSHSLSAEFRKSFINSGGKVLENEFDLSNPKFNEKSAIDKAQKQGATVLAVFPDGGTSTYGISKTLDLVTANQGHSWIVGSNTLYSSKTLTLLGKDALNRFVVVVPWHHLDSDRNPVFPQAARKLWAGNVSWRTATAYDATRALIVALTKDKQQSPSRESLRQILADKNFQAQGATGTISFQGGDRKEDFSTLVKVVRSNCSPNSYTFVPVDYKNLEQDCGK